MSKLVLIDGNGVCYAAGAVTDLCTSTGIPVSAIHGGLYSMKSAVDFLRPDAVVVVWDHPDGAARRRNICPYYKAHRHDPNIDPEIRRFKEELHKQIAVVDSLLKVIGVASFSIPGYEADDVIAALAKLNDPGPVVIVSNDKDFAQLVDQRVSIYLPTRKRMVTEDTWGEFTRDVIKADRLVLRDSWPLFRALVGDDSDGIPGVKGVGVKSAAKMVEGGITTVDALVDKLQDSPAKTSQSVVRDANLVRTYIEVMDLHRPANDPDLVRQVGQALAAVPAPTGCVEWWKITREYELKMLGGQVQGFQRAFNVAAE